ncbi:hypothetical protein F0562_006321 [Nyssa sinensis]|uniref:Uncharacterized protein n=1 Tax=Nyssa sinensis TaxID=561372 RepID=A0A5J5APD1_9ASTE|nr:hypothetical protein F0562_006321 [Nyssa sinensis]
MCRLEKAQMTGEDWLELCDIVGEDGEGAHDLGTHNSHGESRRRGTAGVHWGSRDVKEGQIIQLLMGKGMKLQIPEELFPNVWSSIMQCCKEFQGMADVSFRKFKDLQEAKNSEMKQLVTLERKAQMTEGKEKT